MTDESRPSPPDDGRISRRDALRVGGQAAFSTLPLAGMARPAARPNPPGFGSADSCLILFLGGGPSHLDTFDPKPDAPAEVRGAFRPIATAAPGLRISEHLPGLARVADRFTLVRSLTHDDLDHDDAAHRMIAGRPRVATDGPGGGPAPTPAGGAIPPSLTLPDHLDPLGPDRGHRRASPLLGSPGPVLVHGNPDRPGYRPAGPGLGGALRRAAEIDAEPDRVRDRYGRNQFGQSVLLGRRMVEAGARLVRVNRVRYLDGGWDTHSHAAEALASDLLPTLDRAASALLADLSARGLLDRTLVVVMGEFGRTPRINAQGGRDHWPSAFSALLAGAGLPGGHALGATDRLGAYPADRPVTPGQPRRHHRWALGESDTPGHDPAATGDESPLLELWGGAFA